MPSTFFGRWARGGNVPDLGVETSPSSELYYITVVIARPMLTSDLPVQALQRRTGSESGF
jgi:hypothetical protein